MLSARSWSARGGVTQTGESLLERDRSIVRGLQARVRQQLAGYTLWSGRAERRARWIAGGLGFAVTGVST